MDGNFFDLNGKFSSCAKNVTPVVQKTMSMYCVSFDDKSWLLTALDWDKLTSTPFSSSRTKQCINPISLQVPVGRKETLASCSRDQEEKEKETEAWVDYPPTTM